MISYNAAISACEKGSQWEKALGLLQEMTSSGIKPNVISYNAAISACEKGSQWEKALGLLQEMPSSGIKPDRDQLQRGNQRLREREPVGEGFGSPAGNDKIRYQARRDQL